MRAKKRRDKTLNSRLTDTRLPRPFLAFLAFLAGVVLSAVARGGGEFAPARGGGKTGAETRGDAATTRAPPAATTRAPPAATTRAPARRRGAARRGGAAEVFPYRTVPGSAWPAMRSRDRHRADSGRTAGGAGGSGHLVRVPGPRTWSAHRGARSRPPLSRARTDRAQISAHAEGTLSPAGGYVHVPGGMLGSRAAPEDATWRLADAAGARGPAAIQQKFRQSLDLADHPFGVRPGLRSILLV
jgi:hypothetical protein